MDATPDYYIVKTEPQDIQQFTANETPAAGIYTSADFQKAFADFKSQQAVPVKSSIGINETIIFEKPSFLIKSADIKIKFPALNESMGVDFSRVYNFYANYIKNSEFFEATYLKKPNFIFLDDVELFSIKNLKYTAQDFQQKTSLYYHMF